MARSTTIASDELIAEVSPRGAELMRLDSRDGRALLWHGDPAWWTGRSPLLFPIVGRAPEDVVVVDGRSYAMAKHGLARLRDFALVAEEAHGCTFRLASDDDTRACYPFDFVLDVSYEIAGRRLSIAVDVRNDSPEAMPMQLGFHPAFRWPLSPGAPRAGHEIVFEHPEPAGIRRLSDGLLFAQRFASPVVGNRLNLDDGLFVSDALIFDTLVSRSVRYGTPGGPWLEVDFPGMPYLGIWTKPGAPFICIEPWQGMAAQIGRPGELRFRPGAVVVPAGAPRRFAMSVTLLPASP